MINSRIISQQQEIGQKPESVNQHQNIGLLLEITESLTESISNLKSGIKQKKQALNQLTIKHDEFSKKISANEDAIAQQSNKIVAGLISKIDSANVLLEKLRIELKNTTQEIDDTSENVTALIDQNKQLCNKIEDLGNDKARSTIKINELNEQKLSIENSIKSTTDTLQTLKHKKISILTKILLICVVVVGWIILAIKHHNNERHNTETDKNIFDLNKKLRSYQERLPKLTQEITEKTNELKKINQDIDQNTKDDLEITERLQTLETLTTYLKEQKNKLSTEITKQIFDINELAKILEQVEEINPNIVSLNLSREVETDYEKLKELRSEHNLLTLQQKQSLEDLELAKKTIGTQETKLSSLEIKLSNAELSINSILEQQEQNQLLFPPQPKNSDNDLIVQQFPPAEIIQSPALIHPQNSATVNCQSEDDVDAYLVKLGTILKGLTRSEVKSSIETAKNYIDYKTANLIEKYNVLLSRALHILNFSSQEQILYRASGLSDVANNQSGDYDKAHVYYPWVFEKLIEEIASQSESYEVQFPTNYKKINDKFGDVVNAVSSNAYPLSQLQEHRACAVNFFANIDILEKALAEKNPNLLLHSYVTILETNFKKLSRNKLREKDLKEVLDLIIIEEQTKKRSELKIVLTSVITHKTKEIINENCKDQREQAIQQQMLLILLENHISDTLDEILAHSDYANLNADLNTICEKELKNIAYEVFNKLNKNVVNEQIDEISLQKLRNQMKLLYQEQLKQQQESQLDHHDLLNGLKIMRLTNISEDDQEGFNAITTHLNNTRTQYKEFISQGLALTEKINNSDQLNYNGLAELENEISQLEFNPPQNTTYEKHVRNFYREYNKALSAEKLDSLDFSILDQDQAPEQAMILAPVANSIAIPKELNGFLGLGINPDQLLFDADGNESLEVDSSRRDVLTKFATLHSMPNKSEKELQFYNAITSELSILSKLHEVKDKSNDLKLESTNNTEIQASIVNNWNNLAIDTVRNNIFNIAMKKADSSTVLLWRLNPEILDAKINDYILAIIYENGTTKGLPDWAIDHLVNHSDFMMESNSELTKYIFSLRGLPESWVQLIKYDASKQHFYLAFGGSNNTSDAGHKCFHRAIKTLEILFKDERSSTILNKIAQQSELNLVEVEYMKTKYPEKNIPKKQLIDNNQQDIKTITDCMYNLKTRNVDPIDVDKETINGAYYEKIFCDILVNTKEKYSIKKSAESVTILLELSNAIYALHDVGNYAQDKNDKLDQKWQEVSSKVKILKPSLPNIDELDEILKVATLVKNAKAQVK